MGRAPYLEIHLPHIMNDMKLGIENNDFQQIYDFCDFVDKREDCNDFRMISLQRMYIQFSNLLPKEVKERIKTSVLNFRYWMTEDGNDNMCYWSENHQLLFATIEYIGALLFPNDTFTNDNKLGKDKLGYAEKRIHHWYAQRFNTGFIEWHSHVYYAEDLAALMHLIDFSQNDSMIKKATIITDILFLDIAMHSYKGNFALTHGRSYENQKKSPKEADVSPIVSDAFGLTKIPYITTHIASIFSYRMNYEIPKIISDIAKDDSEIIVKDQMGYDLKTVKKELDLKDELDRFVLWQMESFTNPEAIAHTIDMLNEYDLYSNEFLGEFKSISNPFLRKLGLLPTISRVLKPITDGVAIQQANTYTYKTKNYSMSTAQNHYPGTPGDQQHIMNICFGEDFNIFVTHPASSPYDDENAYLSLSPNNWVGNGRMPHSVQDKNINITMFKIPKRKTFMERILNDFTHAYFPTKHFDQYDIEGNYSFMRFNDSLFAFITKEKVSLKSDNELIQQGKDAYWISECSSTDIESYDAFKKRIRSNSISQNKNTVQYTTNSKTYELTYKGDFKIDNHVINTLYNRFETPYIQSKRFDKELKVKYNDQSITWNLDKLVRKEDANGK